MKCNRVALIGLDGSGKSANIDLMKADFDYAKYIFTWVRWKPTILKPVYKMMGNKVNKKTSPQNADNAIGVEKEKNTEEQVKLRDEYNKKASMKKQVFRNPIVRKVWIGLATFDYIFQFYGKTFVNLITQKDMIFDRFYLDLYVDQGINFGYSPEKIAREIHKHQWMFPKMTQIIYIKVQPEICYRRKDDIPNMDYLTKRYNIYEYLAQNDGWTVVDGEMPLMEVNKSIKSYIL